MTRKEDLLGKVVWLERGWQPVYYGFCPSRRAWSREMRKLGCQGEAYPSSDATTTTFTLKGKCCVIVTLGERVDKDPARTRVEIAGLLCHEAAHVWQKVREQIGETSPSAEFEAYAMQAIFQNLYQAWLDTRAPEEMKARNSKRTAR